MGELSGATPDEGEPSSDPIEWYDTFISRIAANFPHIEKQQATFFEMVEVPEDVYWAAQLAVRTLHQN